MVSYLEAYFGERLSHEVCRKLVNKYLETSNKSQNKTHWLLSEITSFVRQLFVAKEKDMPERSNGESLIEEASSIVRLLERSTEEMDNLVHGLSGGYIRPAPGTMKIYIIIYFTFYCLFRSKLWYII